MLKLGCQVPWRVKFRRCSGDSVEVGSPGVMASEGQRDQDICDDSPNLLACIPT
ncbi:hypothetical protein QJS10_CPB13g00766 [Acorus calamus]|uniref:Uncharacterized protein n=1 Tax=Acorus calamus TaxID=4465 RepID=A0AAV9DFB4_ACOCL|nr:hypothetical protein QJS10_CPB13g00766 [Acorus calamus]